MKPNRNDLSYSEPDIHLVKITQDLCISFFLLIVSILAPSFGFSENLNAAASGATISLTGPWKFHTGDDPSWSDPMIDDSNWESVDLTAPVGARDNDLGLPGYLPGWSARGHAGYAGFAWYRASIVGSDLPQDGLLAIAGPLAVDSAYQIYVDGRLLGAVGDFSVSPPKALSNHRPTFFRLPPRSSQTPLEVAIRTWASTWPRGDDFGGIHVAPILGSAAAVYSQYRLQWRTVIKGYILDAVEGLLLALLAAQAFLVCLRSPDRVLWGFASVALLLLAIHRGNQAVMFLGNIETMREFELLIIVLAIPGYTGFWAVVWARGLLPTGSALIYLCISALTLIYMMCALLTRSWFIGILDPAVLGYLRSTITVTRYGLLLAYLFIAGYGLYQYRHSALVPVVTMLILGIGLFATELSQIRVPGIWFYFGIGVSRTEIAYAFFLPMFAVLLFQRALLREASDTRTPQQRRG